MTDKLIHCMCGCIYEELECPNCNKVTDKDRIEELGAENIKLREAVYINDLTVTMLANDKKKALAGIGRALDFLGADMPNEAKAALRSTLAELTGGKYE